MSTTDVATIAALVLNAVALGVVAYQTWLTRKSLRTTNRSLELSIKTMQVEMLPNANWVIRVRVDLERWIADLQKVVEECKAASKKRDADRIKAIADGGLRSPRGLVSGFGTKQAPSWLTTIWLAGAQYYYDAKAPQTSLWKASTDTPWFDFVPDFIIRCEDSRRGLQQLLRLIDDVVPEVYLNSPASVNGDKFLD